jgi:hypothetical protein
MGPNGLLGWINDVKSSMGRKKKAPVDPVAADLAKLKKESNIQKRIALCEQFLKTHAAQKAECEEVEDLLAEAMKQRGVEEAKKAYLLQAQKKADPKYNPGNKFDLKELRTDVKGIGLKDATKSGLSKAEVAAVKTFTGDDYRYINPAVANQKDKAEKKGDWMDQNKPNSGSASDWKDKKRQMYEEGALHAGMMAEALKKLKTIQKTVFRGTRMTPDAFKSAYQVGSTLDYEAFVSTSTAESVSLGFAAGDQRTDPKATVQVMVEAEIVDLRDIQKLSLIKSENELLASPGTKLRVESIADEESGKRAAGTPAATAWKRVKLKQLIAKTD